jgi:flagellar M-ring protein FliF
VVVNDRQEAGGHLRTKDDIAQLRDLATAAAGIDSARGDVLELKSLPFPSRKEEFAAPTRMSRIWDTVSHGLGVLRIVALVLVCGAVYLLVIRPLAREAAKGLERIATLEASTLGAVPAATGLPQHPDDLKETVLETIGARPQAARKVLRKWLNQG